MISLRIDTPLGLIGDSHGDCEFIRSALDHLWSKGCTQALQLGDFGYWPHVARGQDFLQWASTYAESRGMTLYWLDGNHENHEMLALEPRSFDGTVRFGNNLIYLPRGTRLSWGQLNAVVIGGAPSIDREYRVEGQSWWSGEELSVAEAEAIIEDGPTDLVFAHDCPAQTPLVLQFAPDDFPAGFGHRKMLSEIADQIRPSIWFHGHYHQRHSAEVNMTPDYKLFVEGFACDGSGWHVGWEIFSYQDVLKLVKHAKA